MRIPPETRISTQYLLFDMDGTLVDSTAAVEHVWGAWAAGHGIALESFRHSMHGRRAIDIMRSIIPPHLDPEAELRIVDDRELIETDGIVPIRGAAELLAGLPRDRWALVTSAQLPLAKARMAAAGLPLPEIIVSSDDIPDGKPNPACYRLALERLGCTPENAIVFEDAPAGLAAGHAAGCRTIALATVQPENRLDGEEWLPDFSFLTVEDIEASGSIRLRVL